MRIMKVDKVTKLKIPKVIITSDDDVKKATVRPKNYNCNVSGITGLRIKIKPQGSKTWEGQFKTKAGKVITIGYGSWPEIKLNQAIKLASHDYSEIRQGNDPKRSKRLLQQTAVSQNRAEIAIVDLCEERTAHLLNAGKMGSSNAELDRLYIRKLGDLIGRRSFADFSYKEAQKLYQQTKDRPSDCEKLHKLLLKTFNYLDGKTKELIPIDIASELKKIWPLPNIAKNSDKFIRQSDLGLFWARLMHSSEAEIHKNAALMALLTGERKSAVLNIRKSNIHLLADVPYLYVEGKTSKGVPTKNILPITAVLGTFIKQLIDCSTTDYLFPSQRQSISPNLSNIARKLFDDLGELSGHKQNPHSLRRTTAHLAATCIGSQQLADEHILHFHNRTSEAKANYLDPQSQEFLIARLPTYEKLHKHIDDVITSQGLTVGIQPLDISECQKDEVIPFIIRKFIFPPDLDPFADREDPFASPTVAMVTSSHETGIQVSSPLYSYLAQEPITVTVRQDRPHTAREVIHQEKHGLFNEPRLKTILTGRDSEPAVPDFKSMIE